MLACYPSKKLAREAVGTRLRYRETSMFGTEYKAPGTMTVAYRPQLVGLGGREWFGTITVDANGIITQVE